jgi:hypothetical protein
LSRDEQINLSGYKLWCLWWFMRHHEEFGKESLEDKPVLFYFLFFFYILTEFAINSADYWQHVKRWDFQSATKNWLKKGRGWKGQGTVFEE